MRGTVIFLSDVHAQRKAERPVEKFARPQVLPNTETPDSLAVSERRWVALLRKLLGEDRG